MQDSFLTPQRFTLWRRAFMQSRAGTPVAWWSLFDGYQTTLDWPGADFWRKLAAAHPQARVILTERDAERWYASAEKTIFRLHHSAEATPSGRFARAMFELAVPAMRDGNRVVSDVVWDGTFDGRFTDRDDAMCVPRRACSAGRTLPSR